MNANTVRTPREAISQQCFEVLAGTGLNLVEGGEAEGIELVKSHDVHAYYLLSKDFYPNAIANSLSGHLGRTMLDGFVLHVQAYPGPSTDEEMAFLARFMDRKRRDEMRARGTTPGNEHEAVITKIVGAMDDPFSMTAWDSAQLADRFRRSIRQVSS